MFPEFTFLSLIPNNPHVNLFTEIFFKKITLLHFCPIDGGVVNRIKISVNLHRRGIK
jgi:hypothetical protein